MKIKIEDHISDDELKCIVIGELKRAIRNHFDCEKRVRTILSDIGYRMVYKIVDENVEGEVGSQELIEGQIKEILKRGISDHLVFRDASYGGGRSIGQEIVDKYVESSKELIQSRVREVIRNRDYDPDVRKMAGRFADDFSDFIYSLIRHDDDKD